VGAQGQSLGFFEVELRPRNRSFICGAVETCSVDDFLAGGGHHFLHALSLKSVFFGVVNETALALLGEHFHLPDFT